jgi:integrator complex subunit 11
MSFSAHADANGIKQLIKDVDPGAVLFVHGESQKMDVLKGEVEKVIIDFQSTLALSYF